MPRGLQGEKRPVRADRESGFAQYAGKVQHVVRQLTSARLFERGGRQHGQPAAASAAPAVTRSSNRAASDPRTRAMSS